MSRNLWNCREQRSYTVVVLALISLLFCSCFTFFLYQPVYNNYLFKESFVFFVVKKMWKCNVVTAAEIEVGVVASLLLGKWLWRQGLGGLVQNLYKKLYSHFWPIYLNLSANQPMWVYYPLACKVTSVGGDDSQLEVCILVLLMQQGWAWPKGHNQSLQHVLDDVTGDCRISRLWSIHWYHLASSLHFM